uniref:Uncharacterized protein n=1 Tax=Peronospora matthiolae TaxID=2874970 RepID=A0AAV1T729_9STRA
MASVLSPSICRRVTPRSAAARAEQQRGVLVRARPHYGAAGLEQRSAGADRARVARQVPSNRSYHSPSTSGSSLKFFSSLSSSFSPPPSLDLARGDGWQCLTPPRCEAVVVPSVGQGTQRALDSLGGGSTGSASATVALVSTSPAVGLRSPTAGVVAAEVSWRLAHACALLAASSLDAKV